MRLDGLTLNELAKEIDKSCSGLRIEKVASSGSHAVSLSLQRGFNILVSSHPAGARAVLAGSSAAAKTEPTAFAMLLRKHLEGGRLLKAAKRKMENAIELWFKGWDDDEGTRRKLLLLEATGPSSNLFFLDSDNTILGTLKRTPEIRAGSPGQKFEALQPFEMPDAFSCTKEAFVASSARSFAIRPGIAPRSAIAGGLYGLSADHVGDLLELADCRTREIEALASAAYEALRRRQEHFGDAVWPCCEASGEKGRRVSFIKSALPSTEGPSACLERLIGGIEDGEQLSRLRSSIMKSIDSALARTAGKLDFRAAELTFSQDSRRYRLWADAILSSLNELTMPLPGRAKLHDYSQGYDAVVEVPLDPSRTATQNAEDYYRRYNRGRRAEIALRELIAAAEAELNYLSAIKDSCERADSSPVLEQIRAELEAAGYWKGKKTHKSARQDKRTGPAQYTLSTGHRALVGRNNSQNDELTFGIANPWDIWFHVKGAPGSHVVLRLEKGEKPAVAALKEAAGLAAANSSVKGGPTEVDYTEVRRVKKIKGGLPGAVTYTEQKTIAVKAY